MSDEFDKADLEEAAKQLASQRQQRERQKIVEATAGWVWCSGAFAFVRRSDHLIWADRQFKSHFAHLEPKGDILKTVMRKPGYITKFEKLVFEPGAPEEVEGIAYNLWRPSGIEPAPGDVGWFREHIAYLFPDPNEAGMVLDFLALLVREPWQKVLFALLVYGALHGTGKSALGLLMRRLLGAHNVVFPSNDEIGDKYTSWQEGAQLAIIEEMMTLGRQQIINRLKPVITQPDLRIRAMYRADYSTPNRLNLMAFSNYADALKLENQDRRWFVVESTAVPRDAEYYTRLFNAINSDEGAAAVLHFLRQRDVQLNPLGRAPATMAKQAMVEKSTPDAEAYVIELFEAGEEPFDSDLVRVEDLVSAVQMRFRGAQKNLMARMSTLLKERIGAKQQTRNTTPTSRLPKWRLWSVRNHEHWEDAKPGGRMRAYMDYKRTAARRTSWEWREEPTEESTDGAER